MTARVDPRVARNTAAALAAARDLLVAQGWEAVTHVAVADRSGVGRTTLYRHWPDAASMLRDVVTAEMADLSSPVTGRLRDDLIAAVEVFRVQLHDPVMERIMRVHIERGTVDPSFRRIKEELFANGRANYEAAFDAAGLSGQVDVARAMDRLLGPLLFRRMFAGDDFGDDYVAEVVDEFLAGRHLT